MTPQEFCRKYNVKVKGKFHDNVAGSWPHTAYKAKLKYGNKTYFEGELKFPYRMGLAHTDFDPMGALFCVAVDAKAGEHLFEVFCDEYGYDADSIEARETWKACVKMQRKAYEFCRSEEMYDDLKSMEY